MKIGIGDVLMLEDGFSVFEDDVYGYYTEIDYVYDCYVKPYLEEGKEGSTYTESDYFYEYYTLPLIEEAEGHSDYTESDYFYEFYVKPFLSKQVVAFEKKNNGVVTVSKYDSYTAGDVVKSKYYGLGKIKYFDKTNPEQVMFRVQFYKGWIYKKYKYPQAFQRGDLKFVHHAK